MLVPFGQPMISSEEKGIVLSVLNGPVLVHGQKATDFESLFKDYTGANEAISVSSCTAGMHLVWLAVGLEPGDEVIVPSQTHVATAHAVELAGGTPVFVDVDRITGNIDLGKFKNAITDKCRGVAVVHYLGVPAPMREIMEIARENNLFVLEDCALSLGATYNGEHTGVVGDAGVFSFYPVKHITTAEGGMILVKDQNLAKKLRLKKAFGVDRTHGEREVPGMYDVVDLGLNYRMSEIHAAIGIEQLGKLGSFLEKRKENFKTLERLFSRTDGCVLLNQPTDSCFQSSFYCASLIMEHMTIQQREKVMLQLKQVGVGTSVYYPHPVPRLSYYRQKYKTPEDSYVNAAFLSDRSIALPVGPHLDSVKIKYLADAVLDILQKEKLV